MYPCGHSGHQEMVDIIPLPETNRCKHWRRNPRPYHSPPIIIQGFMHNGPTPTHSVTIASGSQTVTDRFGHLNVVVVFRLFSQLI